MPGPADVERIEGDELRCLDPDASLRMKERIDSAAGQGDTLGGVVEVLAYGVPPGLGSHAHWDRRLDGLLAQAVMSIQSCKGVEVGDGSSMASAPGSSLLDLIAYEEGAGFHRLANHAGGIEGGISNGEAIVVRAAFKPIPTLGRPAPTVDISLPGERGSGGGALGRLRGTRRRGGGREHGGVDPGVRAAGKDGRRPHGRGGAALPGIPGRSQVVLSVGHIILIGFMGAGKTSGGRGPERAPGAHLDRHRCQGGGAFGHARGRHLPPGGRGVLP